MSVRIDRWIAMVSTLLSPALPGDAIAPLRSLKPFFERFAATAFTADTAQAVASAQRFGPVPGWDKIEPILRQAVRDARPINGLGLPAPATSEYHRPDADEVERIRAMVAGLIAEQRAREPSPPLPGKSPGLRDVSLSGERLAAARAAGIITKLSAGEGS